MDRGNAGAMRLLVGLCLALLVGLATSAIDSLPDLALSIDQPKHTEAKSATFTFSYEEATLFECSIGAEGNWQPCSSPSHVSDLNDGSYVFQARAVDGEGTPVTKAMEVRWTVDASAPAVEITSGPGMQGEKPRDGGAPAFTFQVLDNEGGSGISSTTCWLDGAVLEGCQSPLTLAGLDPGTHSLLVEAVDAAGNTGRSEERSWEVRAAPRPELSGPGDEQRCSGPFQVTVRWLEAVESFATESVSVGGDAGARIGEWQQVNSKGSSSSSTVYTATVVPSRSGEAILTVPAGAARSAWGVASEASEALRVRCDVDAPRVRVLGPRAEAQPTEGPISVTFLWSEPVSGFLPEHIEIRGVEATLKAAWSPDTVGTRFSATLSPAGAGLLSVRVASGAAKDDSGNPIQEPSEELQVRVGGGQVVVAGAAGDVSVLQPSSGIYGAPSTTWSTGTWSTGGLLAAMPDGRLLAASENGTTVQVLSLSDGAVIHTISGFTSIAGLACDGRGRALVSDSAAGRVAVLDGSFAEVGSLGGSGGLSSPAGVAAGSDGWVYVAEAGRSRVAIFDEALAFVGSFPAAPAGDGAPGGCPRAIEVNGRGQVFVACPYASTVDIFEHSDPLRRGSLLSSASGEPLFRRVSSLGRFASPGKGSLKRPQGLASDRRGRLLIADKELRGLLVWDPVDGLGSLATEGDASYLRQPLAAVASVRDRKAPTCSIAGPDSEQHEPFNVTFRWSEPVVGFTASCISSADHALDNLSSDDGQLYTATVTPGAVGMVELEVVPGCVSDADGNTNVFASNRLEVPFFGGSCSADLGCKWRLAEYEHSLAERRLRLSIDLEAEKERVKVAVQEAAEDARAQRKLDADAEAQKRQLTAQERLAEIEAGVVRERAEAEAEGRIKEARENEELRLRQMRQEAEARTEMILSAISSVASFIEAGVMSLVNDPKTMQTLLTTFGSAAALFFVAREGARVAATEIARLLSKPPLVRETSRSPLLGWAASLLHLFYKPPDASQLSKLFGDVVLEGKLHEEVEELASSVALATSRGAPLRNVLLWGPPGTGKTMAARRMARGCGMGYAMMSGGDVVPLGKDAVTELHAIFNWAERSSQGVLLFIDEADAFLRRRKGGDGDSSTAEHTRAAINAVLARTGTQSTRFMMVLASNRPEDLDTAVLDRIDDTIHFPLPGVKEREGMIKLYFTKYIGRVNETDTREQQQGKAGGGGSSSAKAWTFATPDATRAGFFMWKKRRPAVQLVDFGKGTFRQAAELTEGFSGRELAKLMSFVQAAVYGQASSPGGKDQSALTLSSGTMMDLIRKKAVEHSHKDEFRALSKDNEVVNLILSPSSKISSKTSLF